MYNKVFPKFEESIIIEILLSLDFCKILIIQKSIDMRGRNT